MAEQVRLQRDLKRISRIGKSGWILIILGVIFIGVGYSFYDSGLRYSGLMLLIMGIASIAFGFIIAGYSAQIRRKYMG
ncbi:MAG: hypothetical protein PVF15_09860 [Candidatus Bathyarchaeota archaeon]